MCMFHCSCTLAAKDMLIIGISSLRFFVSDSAVIALEDLAPNFFQRRGSVMTLPYIASDGETEHGAEGGSSGSGGGSC